MTSLLLATGIASGLTTALFPPQYLASVTVYRGDPLGTVAAIGSGGIEVVSRPRLLLTAGQSGYFQVGQTIPPENSLSMRLNCTPAPGGLIETMFETHVVEFAPPPPGIGGGLVEMRKANTSQSRITARPAAPVTIRLVANSPTDQTWAVLSVSHFHGPPPVADGVAMVLNYLASRKLILG